MHFPGLIPLTEDAPPKTVSFEFLPNYPLENYQEGGGGFYTQPLPYRIRVRGGGVVLDDSEIRLLALQLFKTGASRLSIFFSWEYPIK